MQEFIETALLHMSYVDPFGKKYGCPIILSNYASQDYLGDTEVIQKAPHDVVDSINLTIFTDNDTEGAIDPVTQNIDKNKFMLCGIRKLGRATIRSQGLTGHPAYFEIVRRGITNDGALKNIQSKALMGWRKDGQHKLLKFNNARMSHFNFVEAGLDIGTTMIKEQREYVDFAPGIALMLRYEWMATVRFKGGGAIQVPASHAAIIDLFKLRDVPDGKSRRPALLTWIRQHLRRIKHDVDAWTTVRRHLRGTTVFEWNDCSVTLQLPQYELERLPLTHRLRAPALT